MLIDGGSTLNHDDLALLRTLYEAGIPAMVLLSKVDLLSTADRGRMASYIECQIREELGLNLPVHPVSVVGADESLLLRWYDSEISPLFEQNRSLVEASIRRKIASLSESVATTLETLLLRSGARADRKVETGLTRARQCLDQAGRRDPAGEATSARLVDESRSGPGADSSARRTGRGGRWRLLAGRDDPLFHVARDILAQRAAMAHDLVACLEQALRPSLEGLRRRTAWQETASSPTRA